MICIDDVEASAWLADPTMRPHGDLLVTITSETGSHVGRVQFESRQAVDAAIDLLMQLSVKWAGA